MENTDNKMSYDIVCGSVINFGNELGRAAVRTTITFTKNTEQGAQALKVNIDADVDGNFQKEEVEKILSEIAQSIEKRQKYFTR